SVPMPIRRLSGGTDLIIRAKYGVEGYRLGESETSIWSNRAAANSDRLCHRRSYEGCLPIL
ncbi:MAG: hypothetical protein ABFS45_21785, partial [Pseudomonadota bacterium]